MPIVGEDPQVSEGTGILSMKSRMICRQVSKLEHVPRQGSYLQGCRPIVLSWIPPACNSLAVVQLDMAIGEFRATRIVGGHFSLATTHIVGSHF